jgi:signal transduction histidine kinase
MKLSKKSVGLIIVLIIVSLTGLIILQSLLLKSAMQQKEQVFRRNVMAALNATAQELEAHEISMEVFHFDGLQPNDSLQGEFKIEMKVVNLDSNQNDNIIVINTDSDTSELLQIVNGKMRYKVQSPEHITIKAFCMIDQDDTILVDSFISPGEYEIDLPEFPFPHHDFVWQYKSGENSYAYQIFDSTLVAVLPDMEPGVERQKMVMAIVDRLSVAEWDPIEKRIDTDVLDSLILMNLKETGIDLQPAYGVISGLTDSMPIIQPAVYHAEVKKSDFTTRLFPGDMFSSGSMLSLYFPNHRIYLWQQIGPLLIASIILMIIIIVCFIYTIYTIISQKRFAGLMVDFINNMTHEFKTPISTVALASEAIQRPDVIVNKDQVSRYNDMIRTENRRMRNQVEKILQIAVLEEGDFELKYSDVDVHQLIDNALESIALQVENRAGKITRDFKADKYLIKADSLHLANVIHNLLDNANKYSPDSPDIIVSTENSSDGIYITVVDQGVGISDKATRMVFDKYYRVTSGDVHDVKGFGLGLSYVKLMVEAHGGEVKLDSTPGQGTRIKVYIPFSLK